MDKAALVSVDLERGREVIEALERTSVKVSIAIWVYLPEYEDWRLIVSSRQFDELGTRDAYRLLHRSLSAAGLRLEETPPVMILPMADLFIRELRRIFGKAKSVEGMRLGGQMIGDRFVEDAYAYRIS
jgi:hypothetical protein